MPMLDALDWRLPKNNHLFAQCFGHAGIWHKTLLLLLFI